MVDSPKIGTKEFGDLLRTARERKGMSRNDLVEATGLSYPYISQLETAYRKPSPAAIQKLADALGISLDDIFAAMTQPSPQPLSVRKRTDDAGWIPNDAYAGSAGGPAPARFAAAARPAPAAPSPAPPAPGSSGNAAGSASGGGPPDQHPSVVEQVVRLLTTIPAEARLDALAKIQTEVVESVIDDGIRRGRAAR